MRKPPSQAKNASSILVARSHIESLSEAQSSARSPVDKSSLDGGAPSAGVDPRPPRPISGGQGQGPVCLGLGGEGAEAEEPAVEMLARLAICGDDVSIQLFPPLTPGTPTSCWAHVGYFDSHHSADARRCTVHGGPAIQRRVDGDFPLCDFQAGRTHVHRRQSRPDVGCGHPGIVPAQLITGRENGIVLLTPSLPVDR